MKLGLKLAFRIGVLAIFCITATGVAYYIVVKKSLEERLQAQLESVVILKKNQFNGFVERNKLSIEGLARDESIISNLTAGWKAYASQPAEAENYHKNIRELLEARLAYKKDFFEFFIIDTKERKVHISTDEAQEGKFKASEPYFTKGRKETYIQSFYYDTSLQQSAMTIATPLRGNNEEVIGVLAGRVNLSEVSKIMLERSGLGESGETYLINKFNLVITETREKRAILGNAIYTDGVNNCLKKTEGYGRYNGYAGVPVTGYYTWIPEREICLLAEIEQQEAFAPARKFGYIVLVVGLVIILFILVLSIVLTRGITRPILKLREIANEISRGKLNVRADVAAQDEIGDLALSFNKMAIGLKASQFGLEQKIKEKTSELEKTLEKTEYDKVELEKQRLASLNILEDVSDSQEQLKTMNEELESKSQQLSALKLLSDEFTSVLDTEEVVMIANKYIKEFFDYAVISFLILNPVEEGRIIYNSFLKKEVSEQFTQNLKANLLAFLKNYKGLETGPIIKLVKTVQPKFIGQKLNNDAVSKPGQIINLPIQVGNNILGIIQLSDAKKEILAPDQEELFKAIITAAAFSIDRLHSLVVTQHSKTVSLVESLSDGVVMYNKEEDLTLMNPAFTRYTGLSREYFKMDDLYRLLLDYDLSQLIKNSIQTGEAARLNEVQLIKKYFEVFVTPVRDNRQQIVGGAIIFHDISYLKEIDKMKDEFVSVASHQLRTPLTAIKLFTDMLVKGEVGKLGKEQREYLKNIRESSERMVRLVNDLLNVTRIESGRLLIDPRPVDIIEFLENIIAEAKPLGELEGKKVAFTPGKFKLPPIPLDQGLIRQVFHNIIINSIKYSRPQQGKVEVSIKKDDKTFTVEIKDNGIGIPLDRQNRIFEKFFRADNAIKSNTEGTGLGLYVSKTIVELSGGKLWFVSKENQGTTFYVELPLAGMKPRHGEKGLAIS